MPNYMGCWRGELTQKRASLLLQGFKLFFSTDAERSYLWFDRNFKRRISAWLIAKPGCYPTSIQLSLVPLIKMYCYMP
ncbi:PREDICTED: uncharacterized protein LOC104600878 [Nelumbo nucifera]|uniref:Uncharacterized protein LOC104600878 n=1 Tax=Nelumbo nucifera TaxID=4432 RepID=A0A1U8Q752_NELNU|nr:PREDICTED: uncharacterized protein LOC104600878 [Nelumbo nucifera]XP_019053906.1 PREDICTED: uncharacterized protein LOC104600878 [Nelumbo nucifera]